MRNSRTRMSPERGEISLRKDFPMEAEAKGMCALLNSRSLLKLRNCPCAVSGRRKAFWPPAGPIDVSNIKLNETGGSRVPPVCGLRISSSVMIFPSCVPWKSSIYISQCHGREKYFSEIGLVELNFLIGQFDGWVLFDFELLFL